MADATPPKPPTPGEVKDGVKGGAKGLANRAKRVPKWAWIAGAVVFVGMAYLAWKRSQAAPQDTTLVDGQDPSMFTDQSLPAASQGAFGGGSQPFSDLGSTLPPLSWADLFPNGLPFPLTDVSPAPATAPLDNVVPLTAAAAVTGGGLPVAAAAAHTAPPKNVVKNGKFYHLYNEGTPQERWVYIRPASTAASAPPHPAAVAPRPAGSVAPTVVARTPQPVTAAPASSAAPKPVVKNGKFYHVYNYGTKNERWVYVRPASK